MWSVAVPAPGVTPLVYGTAGWRYLSLGNASLAREILMRGTVHTAKESQQEKRIEREKTLENLMIVWI